MNKKKISIIMLLIAVTLIFTACGGGDLKGTYKYTETYYLVFSGKDKVEWHESGVTYNGTYKKTDDGYHLAIKGNSFVPDQEFDATVNEDGSLVINGKTFKKE